MTPSSVVCCAGNGRQLAGFLVRVFLLPHPQAEIHVTYMGRLRFRTFSRWDKESSSALAVDRTRQFIRPVVQCKHHPLTWFGPLAEAVYQGVALGANT